MKLNETTRSAVACCQPAVSVVVQARSALASYFKHHTPISTAFPSGHSRRYKSSIYLQSLPSFIFSLINQSDRCLVPLVWRLMAEGAGLPAMGV